MAGDVVLSMHRFFMSAAQGGAGPWQPFVDVYHTGSGWLVKFDLAGVDPRNLELRVAENRLTVRGSRHDYCLDETCGQYHMEISYSHFERTVVLPEDVERMQLATDYRDGMLLVRLQKEAPQ